MRINPINNFTPRTKVQNTNCSKNVSSANFVRISPDSAKANFLPSFGQMKKVGETVIYDRKTKEPVIATVRKDNFCNEYYIYNLCVGRKKVGEMKMRVHADFPGYNDDLPRYLNPVNKKTFPQIDSLRTIEGEKYSNIGTELVNLAISESIKSKSGGALWLESCKGYERDLSTYRSGENPIPFYYKLGFRAVGDEDKKIKELLDKGDIEHLPDDTILYLPVDDARKLQNRLM